MIVINYRPYSITVKVNSKTPIDFNGGGIWSSCFYKALWFLDFSSKYNITCIIIIIILAMLFAEGCWLQLVVAYVYNNDINDFFFPFLGRIYAGIIHVILWEWQTLGPYAPLSAAVQWLKMTASMQLLQWLTKLVCSAFSVPLPNQTLVTAALVTKILQN